MKMKWVLFLIPLWLLSTAAPLLAEIPSHPLLEKAQRERRPRVQYALDNGATIHLTDDGKSFYVLWLPEGSDPQNPPPIMATIHGHDGWAFDDFFVWHRFAKERGFGVLAVQWWLGEGERFQDYLNPQEIYRVIDSVFQEKHVKPGAALFQGFSRGSANSYAVAAVDRTQGKSYFSLFIANAGKASVDFPPNKDIQNGRFGEQPLQGTHWVTYAGAKDTHPDRDGIAGMREAAQWIQKYGGTVDLAIEDPAGDHGGFHRNPQNVNAALDIFDKLRTK